MLQALGPGGQEQGHAHRVGDGEVDRHRVGMQPEEAVQQALPPCPGERLRLGGGQHAHLGDAREDLIAVGCGGEGLCQVAAGLVLPHVDPLPP
ncbi:MAG: hypothetical protein H5T59_13255 [Anaerolineae bacterium]|nr:hypothetical protein [Anaerolineae bacterium]